MRLSNHRTHLLRHFRPNGPIRPGQCGRRRPDETPGGISQTGKEVALLTFHTSSQTDCHFLTELALFEIEENQRS